MDRSENQRSSSVPSLKKEPFAREELAISPSPCTFPRMTQRQSVKVALIVAVIVGVLLLAFVVTPDTTKTERTAPLASTVAIAEHQIERQAAAARASRAHTRELARTKAIKAAKARARKAQMEMATAVAIRNHAQPAVSTETRTPVAIRTAGSSRWDRVASCESGGRWNLNSGNGFYGGLQFMIGTWMQAGGGKYASRPDRATRSEQIAVAESWLARTSWRQWPICGKYL